MLCDPGGLETRNENLAFMSMIKWRVVAKINGWYMENSRVSSWANLYSARYAIIWTINLTKSQKPSIVTEISCHFFSTIKVKVEPDDQVVQGQETFGLWARKNNNEVGKRQKERRRERQWHQVHLFQRTKIELNLNVKVSYIMYHIIHGFPFKRQRSAWELKSEIMNQFPQLARTDV